MSEPRPGQRLSVLLIGLIAAAFTAGCPEPAAEEPPPPPSVANAALALRFTAIPAGFEVDRNQGDRLELATTDEERRGRIWVESGERSDFGIDVLAIVNGQKEVFEQMPGGEFSGSRKLVAPTGDAYYSRGRYTDDNGGVTEETRVFILHPAENRLLTFHYTYPAAEDSSERVAELLELLAVMEPLDPPADDPPGG